MGESWFQKSSLLFNDQNTNNSVEVITLQIGIYLLNSLFKIVVEKIDNGKCSFTAVESC